MTNRSSKEQRSVVQVERLLRVLRVTGFRLYAELPPRPDVSGNVNGRRIAIETTDYHADATNHKGSGTRKSEQHDAVTQRIRTYAVPANPLFGLVSRIQGKMSKQYDLSATDEAWLAIFAGVPQWGAVRRLSS